MNLDEIIAQAEVVREIKRLSGARRDLLSRVASDIDQSKPDDWKQIDEQLAMMLDEMTRVYARQMMTLTEAVDPSLISDKKRANLELDNRVMTILISILISHFKIMLERGRTNEAHLHFDRISNDLDRSDLEHLKAVVVQLVQFKVDETDKGSKPN